MSKLYIELSDDDIKIKLDELIGERINKITDNFINEKVSKIIDTKLERLDIKSIIVEAANNLLIRSHGEPKTYSSNYAKILRDEACNLLTEQLKLTQLKL